MNTGDFKNIVNIHNDLLVSGNIKDFENVLSKSQILFNAVVQPLKERGDKKWTELESLIADNEAAWQEQGFVIGFIYAMELKKECEMMI